LSQAPRSPGDERTAGLQRHKRGLRPTAEVVTPELQEFERQQAAEHLARLAADEDLVRFLQLSNFDISTGEWRQFAQALAEYGYAVFRAWFGTGEIVRRMALKTVRGRTVLPSPFRLDEDSVGELAAELVVRGIQSFRENVLLKGRWQAAGGASLKTFFVGHLLFLVPATYRRWRIDAGDDVVFSPDDPPVEPAVGGVPATDRADYRILVEEVSGRLPDTTRQMFQLQADGWSVSDIGRRLGVSESKIKTDMLRARQRLARLYPESDQWIS